MRFKNSFSSILAMAALALMAISCGGSNPAEPDPKPDPVPDPDPIEKKLTHEQEFDGKDYHDVPKDGWEKETKARATALANIPWTPLADVPESGSQADFFPAGQAVAGIPYSDVINEKGYVGRDISFYTFLSALHNPKSKIYTVNYKKPTATGKSTFYGTVCSGAVPYAYGTVVVEPTVTIYHGLSVVYELRKEQDFSKIELFDAICYYTDQYEEGHVMMVYDIRRDKEGTITGISIFEATTPKTRIIDYTYAEFKAKMDKLSVTPKIYFFNPKMKNPLAGYMEQDSSFPTSFPTEICVDRGDKVSIGIEKNTGVSMTVNILASGYPNVELYKDEALYGTYPVSGDSYTFENLPVGQYKACLADGSRKSGFTYFEVGYSDFTVTTDGSKTITINRGSNTAVPGWITTNAANYTGPKPLEKISDTEWRYTGDVDGATHARVHFLGKYSSYTGNSIKMTKQ